MRTLLVILTVCLGLSAQAQKTTVINATQQSWSGGVAGHHGINYVIGIEFTDTTAVPDTAWIGGQYYRVNIAKNDTVNRKVDKKRHIIRYTIYVYNSWNDLEDPAQRQKELEQRNKVKQPRTRKFEGAALISYQLHHKQYDIIVKSFTQLQALNYP